MRLSVLAILLAFQTHHELSINSVCAQPNHGDISAFQHNYFAHNTSAIHLPEIQYNPVDSARIVELLQREPVERNNENPVLWFGKQFLGTPYVGGTLEIGSSEHLIVNLRAMDCTTFVETVSALVLCQRQKEKSFDSFCQNLLKLRYRNGCITDYTSRLHYFTQWGIDNEQKGLLYSVLDSEKDSKLKVQKVFVNYMSRHPNLYSKLRKHPNLIPIIRQQERELDGLKFYYLPKSKLGQPQDSIPYVHTGDIVAIITSRTGLDTSHVGFAVWNAGHLHLMHASSLRKKVIIDKQTFFNYSQKQPLQQGIRLFRIL